MDGILVLAGIYKGGAMDEEETFEYDGITITIKSSWAGYQYEFSYNGQLYFAHYPYRQSARYGAENRIIKLHLSEED